MSRADWLISWRGEEKPEGRTKVKLALIGGGARGSPLPTSPDDLVGVEVKDLLKPDPSQPYGEAFTLRLDGSDRRQLTSLAVMSWAPYFHPSGEYAIFTTNKHGFRNFEVYIVDLMGKKEPVRVTDGPRFDGLPVFTPDGKHMCWTSSRTANQQGQLFMSRWDDAAARQALKDAPPRVEHTAAQEDHSGHGH